MLARRAAVTALVLGCLAAAHARAQDQQTPGLVVDASSGRVLHAERATEPWYPASITKLMTVYVALEQVRLGRVALNSLLTMSETAAAQPPSKLGLKPGLTMTLENAIKVIMVKSANDVANMIGENLGGSVEGFADMMNDASRRLGMRESRWYNPSGLPDPRQVTSARDMAILARALMAYFPEHERLFRIGAVKLGRIVMRNHNGLLGRYPGADGMKTGFICSGGFNVVATATQNGRRLIAVVMGHPSARDRDMRTAGLFDAGFSSFGWASQTVESLPPSSSLEAPDMRPVICGPGRRRKPTDSDGVSQASAGNPQNPALGLFSQGASPAPRELGPRVAFEPEPIWIGAQPGEVGDEGLTKGGRRTRVAGKARTKRASKVVKVGPAAAAFTAASAAPPSIMKEAGSGKRPKLGAIEPRAKAAGARAKTAAAETKPKPAKAEAKGSTAKAAAKPKRKAAAAQ